MAVAVTLSQRLLALRLAPASWFGNIRRRTVHRLDMCTPVAKGRGGDGLLHPLQGGGDNLRGQVEVVTQWRESPVSRPGDRRGETEKRSKKLTCPLDEGERNRLFAEEWSEHRAPGWNTESNQVTPLRTGRISSFRAAVNARLKRQSSDGPIRAAVI
ncbi:hypothetical protein EYF80_030514 [Liparis tanakae]|uniref:Uncharacterized protein n=1 Tax=Liparis tanakae TaxID=230148 RepID=A0A4Z2H0D9_9TELE|nr:hypothetical protein EYF80_030514 [Liparis tanakae]